MSMNVINSLPELVREAKSVLLDIEGTTTSVDFVRKELFTYGNNNFSKYVKDNWNTREVQEVVKELLNQEETVIFNEDLLQTAKIEKKEFSQESIINYLQDCMNKGKKTCRIKELESLIWRNGYINGDLVGHLYPDVVSAFKLWKSTGKNIYIYSTGSVTAQHLLFKHSNYGDQVKFIDKNFDTTIGSKLDPESYNKICREIGKSPSEFVFFSDHPQELFAAKQVGMHIVLIVREPEKPMFLQERSFLKPEDHIIISLSETF